MSESNDSTRDQARPPEAATLTPDGIAPPAGPSPLSDQNTSTPGQEEPRQDPAQAAELRPVPPGWIRDAKDPRYMIHLETGKRRGTWLMGRWKKGQCGNTTGRKKANRCIPDLLRWAGGRNCPDELVQKMRQVFRVKQSLTIEQAIALRICYEALNGNVQAAKFWAERTEGKPVERVIVDDPSSAAPLVVINQAPAAPAADTKGPNPDGR